LSRLHNAVAALTEPGTEPVLRDQPSIRARQAELDVEHRAHIAYLRRRLTHARDELDIDRIHCAMREAGHAHRTRRAALTADAATTASLLDQLIDAVHSAAGAGNGSRGVHRSPMNAAAAELLADIERTVGIGPRPQPASDTLEHRLRIWDPDDHFAAAELVGQWAAAARSILDPPRSLEGTGPCPVCGERWVWTWEGDERIRRAAIRMVLTGSKADDFAVCLNPSCATRWPRTHWDLLAAALRTG
jgi:hypothetical protein